jgi:pilus assembly protein Flp/PilA
MLEFIRNITSRRNEDGASAVEYGLLVAGIGGVIKNAFSSTCGKISGGASAAANASCG